MVVSSGDHLIFLKQNFLFLVSCEKIIFCERVRHFLNKDLFPTKNAVVCMEELMLVRQAYVVMKNFKNTHLLLYECTLKTSDDRN